MYTLSLDEGETAQQLEDELSEIKTGMLQLSCHMLAEINNYSSLGKEVSGNQNVELELLKIKPQSKQEEITQLKELLTIGILLLLSSN